MEATWALLRCLSTPHSAAESLSITAPFRFAPLKEESSKLDRRRSARRKSAPSNLHLTKLDARMSQPDRSAFEKSQSLKSLQHIRDSDRSVFPKLTSFNSDRPKKVRGSVQKL